MKKDLPRCPVCKIVLLDGDKALWCAMSNCPETKQRWATEAQQREFKMNDAPSAKVAQ